jgi:hypothetical protein
MCELPAVTMTEVLRTCTVYASLLHGCGTQRVGHRTVLTALTARF